VNEVCFGQRLSFHPVLLSVRHQSVDLHPHYQLWTCHQLPVNRSPQILLALPLLLVRQDQSLAQNPVGYPVGLIKVVEKEMMLLQVRGLVAHVYSPVVHFQAYLQQ
jgi:hypothetical protein